MKVIFIKTWKTKTGKKIRAGSVETFDNAMAKELIRKRYAKKHFTVVEEPSKILDKKGNSITKIKLEE